MAKHKIGKFELVDHGIDGSQYFQGCGTTFTEYHHVVTGCGDNFAEALDDALEMLAQYATPNGLPTTVDRDGQQYVNNAAYDDFVVEGLLERICELHELDPNNLPTKPSAMAKMLEANAYDEDAEFDEEEPDREDFDSDEAYDDAYSDFQNRESEWEEAQEALHESLTEDCDNYYYVSIRWCKGIDWTTIYDKGECPDCQETILDGTEDGDECDLCGHVFCLPQPNDDE